MRRVRHSTLGETRRYLAEVFLLRDTNNSVLARPSVLRAKEVTDIVYTILVGGQHPKSDRA